jgi:PASTA domain
MFPKLTRRSAAAWWVAALALSACRTHSMTAAFGGAAGASGTSAAASSPSADARAASPASSSTATASSTASSTGGALGSITLPDVTGQDRSGAEAALRAAGVRGRITQHEANRTVDFATARVCSQRPAAGQATRPDLHVTLQYCAPVAAAVERGTPLVGYTVAEATQRARAAGLRGTISVSQLSEFDARCAAGTVCSITPLRWEIDPTIDLTLYVNRKLTIHTPE